MKCIHGVINTRVNLRFLVHALQFEFCKKPETTRAAVPGYEASNVRARHVQKVLVARAHARVG